MAIATVRELVSAECRRKENAFGPTFFEEHLELVADYGKKLAQRLGANAEIVELAAYLHDLAAIRDITDVPQHASLGADLARRLLMEHGYPATIARKVAQCVASHSSPVQISDGTREEVCISNADAIARIVRPAYWLFYAFTVRKLGFAEGREWVLQVMENSWNGLIKPAKEMAQAEHTLAAQLLHQ